MTELISWEKVRHRMENFEWARSIHNQIAEQTEEWLIHYEDHPNRVSGWGHHYFCSQCFTKIPFVRAQPTHHICDSCGFSNFGSKYDEAWNYLYRDEVNKTVFYAAVLYRLHGDSKYVSFIRRVLSFYSDHYTELKVEVPNGYVGKLVGIDLCDAVGVIWLLQGMQLVKEQFSSEELEKYKVNLFLPEAELLYSHSLSINNIPCWMMSATAMIGMFFEEESFFNKAINSEFGLANQLAKGVTKEGFWLEGSMHYHFYCAEPFLYVLQFAQEYAKEIPDMQETVKRMYQYPVQLAFSNGRFPNPNDSWPLVSFSAYAGQYEWINAMYEDSSYEHALSCSYGELYIPSFAFGGMCESTPKGWIQRLLFGKDRYESMPEDRRLSRCDSDIQFCMLRHEAIELFIKFGFHQRNHSHPDALNIELAFDQEVVSYDLSNSGYGSTLFREWQRKSVAHNTVVIDGVDQTARPRGTVERFDPLNNEARFRCNEVYPGIDYVRELKLQGESLVDQFSVITNEEHTMDWVFHCAGELHPSFSVAESASPGDKDGYQHLLDVRWARLDTDWEVQWRTGNKIITLQMEGSPHTEVYLFRGYEYTSEKQRPGILVRRRGKGTLFHALFTMNRQYV
ncbi:heparinase II/III domain-containing protein [Paenibacillus sp. strain BS8-2]